MRNNNYFGTTINLASRITNVAHPGSFWCSESFIKALSRPSEASFDLKGKYRLKNISDEIELFELKTARQKVMYIDPVCRMLLNQDHKIIPHPQIEGLYFCSQECLEIFIRSHKGN
jgi:YHS domain-containing protein